MDYCVCCGAYVPEGFWICPDCQRKAEGRSFKKIRFTKTVR